jgi:hypothetical protein
MPWQTVAPLPIRVEARIADARAAAIRVALLRRAVPLVVRRDGRFEPLATATLVREGARLALLTAAHVLDGAAAGDLAVPLPREERLLPLAGARMRVLVHPLGDVAVLLIAEPALERRLTASWEAVPFALPEEVANARAEVFVIAGYPAAQTRRIEGVLYARPIVIFTTLLDEQRYAYGRVAQRIDGIDIHTPELDGISGAAVWSVHEDTHDHVSCVLLPAAVQVAFRHSGYLRAEAIACARELLERVG